MSSDMSIELHKEIYKFLV
uniref:Uncharacterized protein n=1 Tax=Rhizophora mucronata TaxID=61149 RepID=A0A2P2J1S0_RHIMU